MQITKNKLVSGCQALGTFTIPAVNIERESGIAHYRSNEDPDSLNNAFYLTKPLVMNRLVT